jgi:hypothetical protein
MEITSQNYRLIHTKDAMKELGSAIGATQHDECF